MGTPLRYFFALIPDEEGLDFLESRLHHVRSRGWEKYGRFLNPSDLHLTLRFLGEVEEETLADLQKDAAELGRNSLPCSYELGRCVLFPRVSRARVIASKVRVEPPLRELVGGLEEICVARGFAPEERIFRPHITLARLHRQMKRPNLPNRPGNLGQTASQFYLMRTNTESDSELYEEVASFPLGGES